MRHIRLLLLTPVLGAGLVMGGVASVSASVTPIGQGHSAVKPHPRHKHKKHAREPYAAGFRQGYSEGFADGKKACRSMGVAAQRQKTTTGVAAFREGFAAGYPSGFSAGCAEAKHH
ncbi:hypothetical protein GCM10023196_086230 [Actinoallomurus vinaceus]|uniref:Uncharacterized protein n=1 Tax=Actinoallomurus vinaceus TaxID=1080074 RepID=A0ABP8UP07_9ACTN